MGCTFYHYFISYYMLETVMFPKYLKPLSNWFRARRNARLIQTIDALYQGAGRPISVLDVGGSFIFWQTIPNREKCQITLLNFAEAYREKDGVTAEERSRYQAEIGNACDLTRWRDAHFDLVTCNSVLEHVGVWSDMRNAARELRRVGVRGWIQVPAFGFPLEQHFLLPFVHWFGEPIMAWLVWNLRRDLRSWGWESVRDNVTHTKPLARWELRRLFPDTHIWTEWFIIFPKSHVAEW
jgi:ubiquinone/menaquinone biosynthesis C-methylase UbiE